MDPNRGRTPHVCRNTVEFHWRNRNQRCLHHCKLYGWKSVTYTDGYRNSYCYGDSDSYTDGNCNRDSNGDSYANSDRNSHSYGYTKCNSDAHTDAYPSIEWINLQWWNAVC